MLTKAFWMGTLERAMKTAAQGVLVILGGGVGLLDVDWVPALLGVLALTLVSVAFSIASYGVGPTGSPSLVIDESNGRHAAR